MKNGLLYAAIAVAGFMPAAHADMLSFNGIISQSTQSGTGPAVNNPSLNAIQNGQSYVATLDFTGSAVSSIHSPGIYDLTGGSLVFNVPSAGASETSFGQMTLVVSQSGAFDDLSLLACLTTGSDCAASNQLTANFQIPVLSLNAANVAAVGLDQPHPLDLLEDEGTTDIQGSITEYSYSPAGPTNSVPEPSSLLLVLTAAGCAAFFLNREAARTRKDRLKNDWKTI